MNIEYVSRNFELDDRVRNFAETKLRKVVTTRKVYSSATPMFAEVTAAMRFSP